MRKAVSGLVLVELVVAMTVASILGLMLFTFVQQATRSSARTAAAVENSLALAVAYTQLERDLMALMVPESSFASYQRAFKQEKQEKAKKDLTAGEKEPEGASEEQGEKRTEEIPPPFYAKFQGDRLELLYFTTTNRMPRHKVFVPYNTRVIYRLVPGEEPEVWKLIRAESADIHTEVKTLLEKKLTSYVLIARLKSLTMKFFVPEEPKKSERESMGEPKAEAKEEEKGGSTQAEKKSIDERSASEKPQKIVYKELKEWDPNALKKAPYMVPAYIEIAGVRLESDGKTERPFKTAYKIPVFVWHYERLKKIVEARTKTKKKVLKEKGDEAKGVSTSGAAGGAAAKKPALNVGRPGGARPIAKPPSMPKRSFMMRPRPGAPQVRER